MHQRSSVGEGRSLPTSSDVTNQREVKTRHFPIRSYGTQSKGSLTRVYSSAVKKRIYHNQGSNSRDPSPTAVALRRESKPHQLAGSFSNTKAGGFDGREFQRTWGPTRSELRQIRTLRCSKMSPRPRPATDLQIRGISIGRFKLPTTRTRTFVSCTGWLSILSHQMQYPQGYIEC
ncbi:hypothetical protein TNCV_608841 [Trichonephila clavipes]|nr:hypothetical protein TNCV_608841 [Trichonephila clavipes]